jgi:glycosyltransferase involved in cell wall biosynthesis
MLSVTVLNYNYGHYLPTCLDSILSQTFDDFEIILINDKSTDNSLAVIQPYLADPRVRLVDHAENKGFVHSLIEGCDLSAGKYITVISADDWIIDSSAFEKQVALLEQDSEVAFAYTAYGHFEVPETCDYIWRAAEKSYVLESYDAFCGIIVSPFLLHSGTIIRKTAYDLVGGYTTNLHYLVDVRMWLSLCHVGKVAYINEALYAYRRHGKNMSKNAASFRAHLEEVLRSIEWSFTLLDEHDRGQLSWLKSKADKKALLAFAIDDIFRNHYKDGWFCFWIALNIRPFQTLFQKDTGVIFVRTVLGKKIFDSLKNMFAKKRYAAAF